MISENAHMTPHQQRLSRISRRNRERGQVAVETAISVWTGVVARVRRRRRGVRGSTGAVLSNGVTTHFFTQCQYLNSLDVLITTINALDVSVSVAAGAPTDTTAPSTVTNFVAQALSQSQVGMVWTAATDNVLVQDYQIYRDMSGTCTGFLPYTTSLTPSAMLSNTAAAAVA